MQKENTSFYVTMISANGKMQELWLPQIAEGIYYFGEDIQHQFLYFEGQKEGWIANCKSGAYFENEMNRKEKSIEIHQGIMYRVNYQKFSFLLYVEALTPKSNVFHNYYVKDNSKVLIGRMEGCDIYYKNSIISRRHVLLRKEDKRWFIEDCDSVNGTFVNGHRVRNKQLKPGDKIYIWGLILIIGYNYLSVNDGHEAVDINSGKIRCMSEFPEMHGVKGNLQEYDRGKIYDRQPRQRVGLPDELEIVIDPPPVSMLGDEIPMLLRMGSSMVMGTNSIFMGNYLMLLSSVMFPVLNQKFTQKQKEEYEELRITRYTEYLNAKQKEIDEEILYEKMTINNQYPAFEKVLDFLNKETRLWERRNVDDDFLTIRVGTGDIPMKAQIKFPVEKFSLSDDPLEQAMYAIAEKKYKIPETAIITSLKKDYVNGISGNQEMKKEFTKMLIMQIALLHSYDEVKLVFLMNQKDLEQFEFIRYIPHTWNEYKTLRYIATTPEEVYLISEELKKYVESDLEKKETLQRLNRDHPYFVLFAYDKKLYDSMELLKDILKKEGNIGVSVIAAFPKLPKECTKVFKLRSNGKHEVLYLTDIDRKPEQFQLETYDRRLANSIMHSLSNINLMLESQEFVLPKMITFLEMYGVGKIEHLNPVNRWKENDPTKSLAAPIGLAADGSLFTLDLHEKYQGPHGLIAGMTGSGKSEFIITYILSMALNYHPDEVAFILIDYKGGGLAGAFDDPNRGVHLPHLVGTITNLDGAAIQRSMLSVQSELMRRQRIFNEAKSIANEGTMDIYAYQKLRRKGVVTEPVPHLFIISDEFAELKSQKPEFMDQLISTARIGRSLGVHLILATQKPAGVVNEQILSNTKFRICLRVQDRLDSMDMLKRPEAAELKETGRFYLQVGYNELFALGQSAWCGAPYEPEDEVVVHRDETIQFIDNIGHNNLITKPVREKRDSGMSQIVALVKLLSELSVKENIVPRILWKKELPDRLPIDSLKQYYENEVGINDLISPYIGIVDDPENQKQFPLRINLTNCRNLSIVGDKESGKTTLLQAMLLSLAENYSPEDVNFYIMDYSSRTMDVFSKLPHCGGVLREEDEENLDFMFKYIGEIIKKRKELFAKLEVSNFEACRTVQRIPLILVVIDNVIGLKALKKGMDIYMELGEYLRAGGSYGVKYIITLSSSGDLLSKARQEVGDAITLHLKDRFEYGEVLNCKCRYTPPEKRGRGLCNIEGRALEYQSAMFEPEVASKDRLRKLKEKIQELVVKYANSVKAKKLRQISEIEEYENFCEQFEKGRMPLGYSLLDNKPIALPLRQFTALSFYFGNEQSIQPVFGNVLYFCAREDADVKIIKRSLDSIFDEPEKLLKDSFFLKEKVDIREAIKENSSRLWHEIVDVINNRRDLFRDYCSTNSINMESADILIQKADFMRAHTKPLVIILERFLDFNQNKDEAALTIFPSIFEVLYMNNIYFFGGFYPGDGEELIGEPLMQKFNPDSLLMLFGGQLDKQGLTNLPGEFRHQSGIGAYNRCLMKYRKKYYPVFMPCGELVAEQLEDDEKSIFD